MFFCIVAICLIGVILVLLALIKKVDKQVKIIKPIKIKVATAGSVVANTPSDVKIQNFGNQEFCDNANNSINLDEFNKFWVKGSSMLLCGIKNNDLLLTKPIKLDDLSFDKPHVFVLRRDHKVRSEAILKKDLAEFKIRRTWAVVRVGEKDVADCARQIIQSQNFQDLKQNHLKDFLSEEDMLSDFNERIKKYMQQYPTCKNEADENHVAIISTTLKASKKNKVTFSIHPARVIEGEVIYSFHL